jgi:hypothetical protein
MLNCTPIGFSGMVTVAALRHPRWQEPGRCPVMSGHPTDLSVFARIGHRVAFASERFGNHREYTFRWTVSIAP